MSLVVAEDYLSFFFLQVIVQNTLNIENFNKRSLKVAGIESLDGGSRDGLFNQV
ncbi:hypothetical protein [uncultured Roseibium sp.]|uniref:hypothetical protein n=1 Tax=uncultured Roseibium sp. TaxID=1936171 RepID=UPI002635E272|nr:hypothetical protein [uncultured Roseibium sp.]